MTDTSLHYGAPNGLTLAEKNRALIAILSGFALWTGAFLSGFVIAEPAPYELFMAGLIGVWALLGLKIPASISPLVVLILLFNVGGIVSLMTMDNWSSQVIYVAVSFFLGLTSIFFAAVVAARPSLLRVIFSGYMAAALITGTIGILAYFGAMPSADLFLRFGRAKGAFQDPNVFAPFLCLPALFCLHQILVRPAIKSLPYMAMLLVIALGIFLSFSRAGWGLFVLSALLLTAALLISNPSGRFRVRVTLLAITALIAVSIALLIALQFEAVRDIFFTRAQLVQDYDGARLGRFARHWIGFMMATEHPFGIGILEFGEMFGEDTHNIWLKALFDYSWLGFFAYVTLMVWTLGAGLKILFRNRPWQPYLLCTYIIFIGHIVIGNVIDTDHWRHFFLLLGIIWGCIAAENYHQNKLAASQ
ncbi:hypothetical protein WNY59_03385 [Ahrensia kielensis]|uniref:O-antigen ligase-related domain-containing protein n=1 Tax=Ahrensia kielensis TaxID=76980 RepID=A0ABU9T3D1_9HYPH